ncbi:arginine--tRNA ligase [Eubacteriales bacterium KG127]
MINYKEQIANLLEGIITDLSKEEILNMLEVPANEDMGDFAFPCFKLAKIMRKAPPLIAKGIAERLSEESIFAKVEKVNAYVNMFLSKEDFVSHTIQEVIEKGSNFANSKEGEGKTVIVEFSSPNIAKPFHIGHIRSTVIGNSIHLIYKALGYDVVRINHLGDYGTQFGKMIVAYRMWGNEEDVEKEPIKTLLGYYTKFHEEAEKTPSLNDEARKTFTRLEKGGEEEVKLWQWFREESLKEFNRVYDLLGITFDSYKGESFYSDKMPRFVNMLKEKGIMEESQGANIVNLEDKGLGIALITKRDGSTLYITRDIAAAVYRKETYDFYKNIYVVASQQNLHFQQWFEIVEILGFEWARDCVHVPFGLVSLEDGTMSTREGRVVFLEEVLNKSIEKTKEIIAKKNPDGVDIDQIAKEVGIGAVMFQELSNNRIKDYTFSWDKVLNFDGETGPYVQYTHARACSLLRKGKVENDDFNNLDFSKLTSEAAFRLTKLIYQLPEVISDAGLKYEPSIVTRHIVDIAQAFNRFYHDEHILVDDQAERNAKLALVYAAKETIAKGLSLLGIVAPEKM